VAAWTSRAVSPGKVNAPVCEDAGAFGRLAAAALPRRRPATISETAQFANADSTAAVSTKSPFDVTLRAAKRSPAVMAGAPPAKTRLRRRPGGTLSVVSLGVPGCWPPTPRRALPPAGRFRLRARSPWSIWRRAAGLSARWVLSAAAGPGWKRFSQSAGLPKIGVRQCHHHKPPRSSDSCSGSGVVSFRL
jgi:hypothetical protein